MTAIEGILDKIRFNYSGVWILGVERFGCKWVRFYSIPHYGCVCWQLRIYPYFNTWCGYKWRKQSPAFQLVSLKILWRWETKFFPGEYRRCFFLWRAIENTGRTWRLFSSTLRRRCPNSDFWINHTAWLLLFHHLHSIGFSALITSLVKKYEQINPYLHSPQPRQKLNFSLINMTSLNFLWIFITLFERWCGGADLKLGLQIFLLTKSSFLLISIGYLDVFLPQHLGSHL